MTGRVEGKVALITGAARGQGLPIPWVTPEGISNAVLFLASEEARYITRVILPVGAGSGLK